MRAKTDTGPALDTNNRTAFALVKVDDLDDTPNGAIATPDTLFAIKPDAAIGAGNQCPGLTSGGAGRIQATTADIGSKLRL
jgi:hypothetical protein